MSVACKKSGWIWYLATFRSTHFSFLPPREEKMALSSLVQTRSMELVLAPIASHVSCSQTENTQYYKSILVQVSQLVTISETRGNASYPGLMHAAVSVMDAIQNMSNTAQTIASESNDEVVIKNQIMTVYEQHVL